jgi:transposase-like protein
MNAATNAPHFHDDDAARAYLEKVRWNGEPVCPHCGSVGDHYPLVSKGGTSGRKARKGLYKCQDCRKQFSVTVGTVFEASKIPLSKWLFAAYLLCSSKKGMSAHQLHRTLGVTYKTAWFLAHRIRLAMTDTSKGGLMGSGGQIVEADETYIGRKKGQAIRSGGGHKHMVFALVERDGEVRAQHITGKGFDGVKKALRENVSPNARLATDEYRAYRKIGKQFAEHMTVNHSKDEYVRGEASTNTVEGFFSVFKRGMNGVYQHCSGDHLHRYVNEFQYRYNNRSALEVDDKLRTDKALYGIGGKRLTYRTVD